MDGNPSRITGLEKDLPIHASTIFFCPSVVLSRFVVMVVKIPDHIGDSHSASLEISKDVCFSASK